MWWLGLPFRVLPRQRNCDSLSMLACGLYCNFLIKPYNKKLARSCKVLDNRDSTMFLKIPEASYTAMYSSLFVFFYSSSFSFVLCFV